MALTFSQKIRGKMGNKEFRLYEVTPDGSATTLDASAMDMNYIDYAVVQLIAPMSAVSSWPYLSGTLSGKYVTLANAGDASDKLAVMAWGW
jgi:hypothetical protein